jgi:hypothetical protein
MNVLEKLKLLVILLLLRGQLLLRIVENGNIKKEVSLKLMKELNFFLNNGLKMLEMI